MDHLNELARECHAVAVAMGFYDHLGPHYQGTVEDEAMLWKQVSHVFIEMGELYGAVSNQQDLDAEAADVAIVILDLMAWLDIPLDDVVSYPWRYMEREAVVDMFFWWALAANNLRKKGLTDGWLGTYAEQVIRTLAGLVDLTPAIQAKLAQNRTRGQRYGVSPHADSAA